MANKKSLTVIVIVFLLGCSFMLLFESGLAYTNKMEFCTSCHSMQQNFKEYKQTVHYKNSSGVRASCSDCHVPKAFGPKMVAKFLAYKDVLHEILGTIDSKEKFEAHRWEMANRVWDRMKNSDSRECKSCHAWDSMELSEQDRSARNRHGRAVDEGQTCIDCHKGIAHEEPDEPEESEDVAESDSA